jgi:hypothetical protein
MPGVLRNPADRALAVRNDALNGIEAFLA